MALTLEPGEPPVARWAVEPLATLAERLVPSDGSAAERAVVAVDGRQGAGKSTLAARLAQAWTDQGRATAVVHTDDIAWWQGFFTWDDLLVDGILRPWLDGRPVVYRPPAWIERGRVGAIAVPPAAAILVVEGVGSSREALAPWLQGSVWMQADRRDARVRGLARDGGSAETEAFWDEWEAAERAFLTEDRPWERAGAVVCGTPQALGITLGPDEVLLAPSDYCAKSRR